MSNISIENISERKQIQYEIMEQHTIPVIIEQDEVKLTPEQNKQLTRTDVIKILLFLMLGIFGFLVIIGFLFAIAIAIIIMHKLEL